MRRQGSSRPRRHAVDGPPPRPRAPPADGRASSAPAPARAARNPGRPLLQSQRMRGDARGVSSGGAPGLPHWQPDRPPVGGMGARREEDLPFRPRTSFRHSCKSLSSSRSMSTWGSGGPAAGNANAAPRAVQRNASAVEGAQAFLAGCLKVAQHDVVGHIRASVSGIPRGLLHSCPLLNEKVQ